MAGEWETKRIGDLGRVVTGKTPSTAAAENFGGNYPFITIPDMDGRREFIERLPVGQKYEQKTVSLVGKVPVLDQGKSGVIGFHNNEPGVTATLDKPVAVFANHTCYMRLIAYSFSAIQNVLPFVGSGVDTFWAYYATEGRLSFSEYKGHWPDFVIQESVVPPRELAGAFGRLAKPLVAQVRNNEEESRTLATLRDTLLPKLLSGELSVAESTSKIGNAL